MGRTTYEWVLAHNERTGDKWAYSQPSWVFTHADLEPIIDNVQIVAGKPDEHYAAIAAGGRRQGHLDGRRGRSGRPVG